MFPIISTSGELTSQCYDCLDHRVGEPATHLGLLGDIIFKLRGKNGYLLRRAYRRTGCMSSLEKFEELCRELKSKISIFCRETEKDLSRDP